MHYIYAGDGLAAIYVKNGTTDTMYYVHKDYLGSMDALTNDKNYNVQYMSFDPWGRRRNPTNWTFTSVPSNYVTDRGYTGHEHMDKFGLINMNGRVYNPVLGRFHNPDPVVTGAGGTQSWNRYSYVLNNPLKYTDPSGYIPKQEWDIERNMRVSRKMEIAGLVNSGSLHNAAAIAHTYQNLPFFGFNNSIFANSTTLGSFSPDWDEVSRNREIAAVLQQLRMAISEIRCQAAQSMFSSLIQQEGTGDGMSFVGQDLPDTGDDLQVVAEGIISFINIVPGSGFSVMGGTLNFDGKDYGIYASGFSFGANLGIGIAKITVLANPETFSISNLMDAGYQVDFGVSLFSHSRSSSGDYKQDFEIRITGIGYSYPIVGISLTPFGKIGIVEPGRNPSMTDLYISRPGGY